MNKPILTAVVFALSGIALNGQSQQGVTYNTAVKEDIKKTISYDRYGADMTPHRIHTPLLPSASRGASANGVVIAQTYYDLQTNSSVDNSRLLRHSDGTLSGVFTWSNQTGPGYSNRGSGYTYNNGTTWTVINPSTRIEGERTGWPSIGYTASGKELVSSHSTDASGLLLTYRGAKGSGVWLFNSDPTGAKTANIACTGYILWPRMAVGGANGNTVHLIALSEPEPATGSTFNGCRYQGIDGALTYNRSKDGGVTWDIKHLVIPGIDSSVYDNINADSYAIDARGDVIAIAVFHRFGDTRVLKSTDNGDTWTVYNVLDFPYDKFVLGDVMITDTLTTSDNSGTVIIDNNGKVHTFFGSWTWTDPDTTDQLYTTFPLLSGLHYWNESYGNNNSKLLTGLVDKDGNPGAVAIPSGLNGIADYGQKSVSSQPSASVDANNNLYLLFSGVCESSSSKGYNDGSKHYRHQFMMKSATGGCTWGAIQDMTDAGTGFEECAYGTMAKRITNKILFHYQEDGAPGTAVGPAAHADGQNDIVYVSVDVNTIPSSAVTCLTAIGGVTDICPGDTATLDASASCGSAYSWSTGASTSKINVTTPGTYYCDITTACGVLREEVTISSPTSGGPGPNVTLISDVNVLCPSGSSTVIRAVATPIGTSGFYEWNNSGIQNLIDTLLITTPGTYTVEVTNCVGSSSVKTITIGSITSAKATISGDLFICPGDSGVISMPLNPDGSYSWTFGGNVVGTNRTLKVNQTGQYIGTATACASSFVAMDTVNISVEPTPTAAINAGGSTDLCEGLDNVTLFVTGQTGATFKWPNGSNLTFFTANSNTVGSQTISCISFNKCGDSTISNTITVTTHPIPTAPTITESNGVFTASATSGVKWYFIPKNSTVPTYSGQTGQTYTPPAGTSGSKIFATVTSTAGCESDPSNNILNTVGSAEYAYIATNLLVFPNPGSGKFKVSVNAINSAVSLKLTNLLGETLYRSDIEKVSDLNADIDVSHLSKGMYILSVTASGETVTRSVIIQ
jgi:hypothetical protein